MNSCIHTVNSAAFNGPVHACAQTNITDYVIIISCFTKQTTFKCFECFISLNHCVAVKWHSNCVRTAIFLQLTANISIHALAEIICFLFSDSSAYSE